MMFKKVFVLYFLLSTFAILIDSSEVQAYTDEKSEYNIVAKENVDISNLKDNLIEQGIIVLDEIPEINVLTVSTSFDSSMIFEKKQKLH